MEEKQEMVVVTEDSLRSGLHEHLRQPKARIFLLKMKLTHFFQKILSCNGRDNGKELNSEILCKFYNGKRWPMRKGSRGKRGRPRETSVAFCGASQPRLFLSKGVLVRMTKAGDGLLERIMTAQMPNLPPQEVQQHVEQLEATGVKNFLEFLMEYLCNTKAEKPGYMNCWPAKVVYNE